MTLPLKIATQFFSMTLCSTMMPHHTEFGYKRIAFQKISGQTIEILNLCCHLDLEHASSIWSRSKPVSKNHWAWFWQNATSLLPVSIFQTWLCSSTDGQGHIVQNQPGSDLVLADFVMFWPNRSDLEASWHARIIGPTSGQCFWADPDTGL